MNETVVFGELEANQNSIYKGGPQENEDRSNNREPTKYYSNYTEAVLLEGDKNIKRLRDI